MENFLSGGGEIINEVFEWGQNKFLGVPDNSTMIQTKKSARQIYAEAFMEEETNSRFGMGSQRRFYDEDQPQPPKSETGSLHDDGDEEPAEKGTKQESEKEAAATGDDDDDPLDRLTSNEEL